MFAVGILAFIFVDVLSNGLSIVNDTLDAVKDHHQSVGYLIWLVVLLAAGFTLGSAGLALLERSMRPAASRRPPIAGGAEAAALDPDSAHARPRRRSPPGSARRPDHRRRDRGAQLRRGPGHRRVRPAGRDQPGHRPDHRLRAAQRDRGLRHRRSAGRRAGPRGGGSGLAGLIGGGPTFLGSLVGYAVTSNPLELAFYAAAGGAILYVIGEVWNGMRRYGHRELALLMLSAGFLVGVLTDLVVAYGGG